MNVGNKLLRRERSFKILARTGTQLLQYDVLPVLLYTLLFTVTIRSALK